MKIIVKGVVQGVGFRPTVARIAKSLNLDGYVKNKGSYVEIYLENSEKEFIKKLKENLPPLAILQSINILNSEADYEYSNFEIIDSEDGERTAILPPDTALCKACINEIFDKNDRRHNYPFTNCTHCGARFSVIMDLPYDRKTTSMNDFPLCDECKKEYESIKDRRFHAETISCPNCGPSFTLYSSKKQAIETEDPIKETAKLLDEGYVCILKSWGGMHICSKSSEVENLRKVYGRKYKPFAVMFKDIETIKKHMLLSKEEEEILKSPQRPITLLFKKDLNSFEEVAPGLPNIGVFLPYTGLHNLLFHHLKENMLVMTSANFSGEPMITENEESFKLKADYFLLHNRKIINRVDDSVIRLYKNHTFFIRRSRGYVPLSLPCTHDKNIVAVGAETNGSVALSKDGQLYLSQYTGDSNRYSVLEYLKETSMKFINCLRITELDAIGMDLHPNYKSRKVAQYLKEKFSSDIYEIQHHHAHAASLMFDNDLNEIIALTLDSTGFGTDGNMWGGEILHSRYEDFKRIGSLEELPLPTGENCIIYPKRMLFTISTLLNREMKIVSDIEEKIILKNMDTSVKTTSFGRILDTISAYFNLCEKRTYEGEPAMRLEKYLAMGKKAYDFEVEKTQKDGRKIIRTLSMFNQLFDLKLNTEKEKADATYSFVYDLIKALLSSVNNDLPVGLTGGTSYNYFITDISKKISEELDLDLYLHKNIPNGDGGVSVGQNLIIGAKIGH